jgi:hypothetical protein
MVSEPSRHTYSTPTTTLRLERYKGSTIKTITSYTTYIKPPLNKPTNTLNNKTKYPDR